MSCSPIEECTLHPDIHYHYAQQADRQSWGYHGNAFRPHTKCKKNRREKAPHTLEQAPSPIVLHSCVNEQRTAPILSKKMSAADIIPGGRPARLTDERPALKAETEGKYTSGWWIRIQLRSTHGNTLHDGYGTTAYCKCMSADLNMWLFFFLFFS